MHTLTHTHSLPEIKSDNTAVISSDTTCTQGGFSKGEKSTLLYEQHQLLHCHQAEHAQTSLGVCACLEISADDVSDVGVAHFDGHHTPHSFNRHDGFVNLQRRP